MKTTKRLSALLVALFMLVSMFSIGASAWETGEGIEVYWNDTLEGTVTYDQILDDISQATKKVTYSAVNKKGTYTAYNTYAYQFSRLLDAVKKTEDWNAAPDATSVEFANPGDDKISVFSKTELTEERYYFDENHIKVEPVKPGFIPAKSKNTGKDCFQFAYGQKTYDETNNSKFVTFDGAGNAEVRFYTPDYVETTDLEVVSPEGDVTGFRYKDLTRLWKKEGSKTYTYSTANTYPTFKNEEYAGPTLEGVLALADIKLDELDDYDVIRFDAYDGSIELTVKEIRATRYSFPNGKSKNNYTGTTEAQRKDGFEVPFIINTTNGKTNLRDVFGMKDPQDQQKSFFIKHLSKITIKKDAAQDFDGMTPTLADGSKVKEADALNFDLALPEDVYEGFVFYTASTDGTEPADPTYADVLYNPSQNQTDDKDYEDPAFAQFYNSYEFTDADKTIIKVACFVPGCKDPKVTTLTYSRSDYNGLANNADRHGNYWYYKDGKIDKTHNGVDHNNAGWWRVENGKVNFKATGVYHNDAGWWYCKNGKVDFGYTGAGSNDAGNWYCKDGKVDFSVNGVVYAKSEGVWYYVKNNKIIPGPTVQPNAAGWWYIDKTGKVDFNHFGVEHNDAGWWRIENGKVNFNFNGIASNAAGSWYLQGGKVDFNKNGRVYYNGAAYNIKGGKVV